MGGDLVRASDPEVAADVAELLAQGRALLSQRVPGLEETSVEVRVYDPTQAASHPAPRILHSAYTLKRPGRRPSIHVPDHGYRDALLHELTHALLGEGWRTLQLAPEEGLCSLLNDEVADAELTVVHLRCAARAGNSTKYHVSVQVQGSEGEPTKYSTFWGNSGGSDATDSTLTVAEILALSGSGELKTMTPAEVGHVYGVGLLVVQRIVASRGIEGLYELCLRTAAEGLAQIPVQVLLRAAGIESDQHFQQLAEEALRSESLRAAIESDSFDGVVRRAIQAAVTTPSDGVDEFLGRFTGTLTINGTPVDLATQPAFQSWLADNWSALRTAE